MLCEKCGSETLDEAVLCTSCEAPAQSDVAQSELTLNRIDPGEFYVHSGRIDLKVLIGLPLVALISFALAFVYAYSVVYIPIVGYLSFFMTLGFSFGVAFVSGMVIQFCNNRNLTCSFCFGALSGVIALYFAWVTFEYVLLNRYSPKGVELMALLSDPGMVWEVACVVAEKGWYSIRSATPSGVVLWGFWIIEAIIIVGLTTWLTYSSTKDSVFCESCRKWADDLDPALAFKFENGQELLDKIVTRDFSFLKDIEKIESTDDLYYAIDCKSCSSCKDLHTLKLTRISRTWDKEGKESEDKTELLQHFLINEEIYEAVKSSSTGMGENNEGIAKEDDTSGDCSAPESDASV